MIRGVGIEAQGSPPSLKSGGEVKAGYVGRGLRLAFRRLKR